MSQGIMRRNRVIGITVAAFALSGAAFLMARSRDMTPERARGSALVAGLESRAAEIGAIELSRGNATVRIERLAGDRWVVATSDAYPARTELVRALLVSIGSLTIDDRMTAKKDRHSELGLAWPDESGKARLVRFLATAPGAEPIAEVILGDERFAPDAVFARLPSQDQTWRALGRVQVPADALAWIDRTLVSLPSGETLSASIAGLTATPSPNDPGPQPGMPRMPWGIAVIEPEREHWSVEQVDSAKTGLPSFLERLEIDGVRRARTDIAPEPQWSPSFDTRAALVTLNGHAEADGVWFTLSVLPRPGIPAPAPAKHDGDPFVPDWSALSEACDGWEYKMPAWKADTLRRMRAPAQDPDAEPTTLQPSTLGDPRR